MTINNNAKGETQALTVDEILKIAETNPRAALTEIDKIAETEGPQAADAALQRMALAREAQGIIAPSDTDDWLVPGDLEVGDGESVEEVIKHLDELDASAEDASPSEPTAKPTAPSDVIETEPVDLQRPDPVADFEVIQKREPWSVTMARFAKMDKQTRTAAKTARQQRWRAGVVAKQSPRPPKPARFPVKTVTPEMKENFAKYVRDGETHLARSLRGRFRVSNLIIALKVYLDGAAQLGRDPTRPEFEKAMRWKSKDNGQARRTVTVLSKVFAEGGFGTDAELAKGEAAIAKADAAEWTFADAENVSTGGASTRGVGTL